MLLEHEQYKEFKKSTDLYFKHPENQSIPVQSHYHVVDTKSKKEMYSVNTDDSAHHRANISYPVLKKQAEELRKLGVNIPSNNILRSKQLSLNKSITGSTFSFFMIIEDWVIINGGHFKNRVFKNRICIKGIPQMLVIFKRARSNY